jgi:hypothetical protein
LRNLSDSHKSNSNLCLGLWIKFKSSLGVKHNDSCLQSLWCYFTRSIMHQTLFDLPFEIYIFINWISFTHVVTSVHDLCINRSPCIFCSKTKQIFYSFYFISFSYQTFNNKSKFLNTKNTNSSFDNEIKRCTSQMNLESKLCTFTT